MKEKKDYIKFLDEVKWENRKQVDSYLIPSIEIKINDDSVKAELGESKFGGTPDFSEGIFWPMSDGKPMIFLAQINCKHVSVFDSENLLPKIGFIYFFIANPEDYPLDYKVLFSNKEEIKKTNFPELIEDNYKFSEFTMLFENSFTFPSGETLEFESLSENDKDSYHELDEDFFTYDNNQILGHTYPAQGDVNLEWACERLGIDIEDDYDSELEIIDNKRREFVNLFQFSTENSVPEFFDNFYMNAMGYFGIEKNDLINLNFDKTILITQ